MKDKIKEIISELNILTNTFNWKDSLKERRDLIANTATRIERLYKWRDASKREGLSEWVSVEDRLPKRESPDEALPVLVSIGETGPVYEAVYEGNGEFCRSIYEDYPADITHWMPLSSPPKD